MAVDKQQRRWSALGGFAIALLVVLLARVWFLQAVTKEETDRIIDRVQSRVVKLIPERGWWLPSIGESSATRRIGWRCFSVCRGH
jgi:cell division protein FtsI/penicillin-binding protein 2